MDKDGIIDAALPRGLYRILTDDGNVVTASIDTAARRVNVKFIPGDRVTLSIMDLDPTRGRIIRKL